MTSDALLRELLARVEYLEAHLPRKSVLGARERDLLGRLYLVIGAHQGSAVFGVSDLLTDGAYKPLALPGHIDLGRLLKKAINQPIEGRVLRLAGRDRGRANLYAVFDTTGHGPDGGTRS